MGRVLIGIVIGIILVPVAALGFLKYGNMPVAVSDQPLPLENFVLQIPLQTRIEFEQVKNPPVKADEDSFTAGAHIYAQECAVCHGFHGKASRFGMNMAPRATPLWERTAQPSAASVSNQIGVSNQDLGVIYWKVANGIRLTGMPAFKGVLTPLQMWQVSTLLANANKPLPPEALALLKGESVSPSPTEAGSSQAAGLTAPAGKQFQVARQPD